MTSWHITDGRLLAIGSTGVPENTIGAATVLEVTSGDSLSTMPGHAGWVSDLALSSDGERLTTVDFRGVGRVWDARTGEPLVELTAPSFPISQIPAVFPKRYPKYPVLTTAPLVL